MKIIIPLVVAVLLFSNCVTPDLIKSKPNIIYILADDLGYGEIGAYGQSKIETPNLNALAASGMMFTQHYSGAPVCAPARAVLLTGQHTGHVAIRGNDEWNERGDVWDYKKVIEDANLEGQRPMPEGTQTLAHKMKSAGYTTGIIGKWGLGAPLSHSIPTKMGFDYFFGYNCQRQAHTYHPVHLYENEKRFYLNNDTISPHTGLPLGAEADDASSYAIYHKGDYAPDITFKKLMNFVSDNKAKPFFLYWASPIPHLPLQAPQRWVNYYVNKFGPEDEPYYFYQGEKNGSYFPARNPRATYAAMISYLDENIGKLISYLKAEGLYDNTLIIFSSDNGPSYTGGTDSPWFDSGGPFDSTYGRGKGFIFEGGIRVPMIASWPQRIKAGSRTDLLSAFWDIMPTFCDLANVDLPQGTDGISFYPTLLGQLQEKTHDYLYWEFPEYNGQVAVRIGHWKVLWKDIKKGNKEIEVYDLKKDPGENNNVVAAHPELVNRFFEIIKEEHITPSVKRFRIMELESLAMKH